MDSQRPPVGWAKRINTSSAPRSPSRKSPGIPTPKPSSTAPADPSFDIETFEPIDPPWPAIREWIPTDDRDGDEFVLVGAPVV
jgi:hypothetical protein